MVPKDMQTHTLTPAPIPIYVCVCVRIHTYVPTPNASAPSFHLSRHCLSLMRRSRATFIVALSQNPPLEREPTECALCKMLANLRDANVLHLRANCCPDFSKGWTASQMMLDLNSSFNAESANKAEDEKTAVVNCVAVHPTGLADHSHARDRPDAAIWKTVAR